MRVYNSMHLHARFGQPIWIFFPCDAVAFTCVHARVCMRRYRRRRSRSRRRGLPRGRVCRRCARCRAQVGGGRQRRRAGRPRAALVVEVACRPCLPVDPRIHCACANSR